MSKYSENGKYPEYIKISFAMYSVLLLALIIGSVLFLTGVVEDCSNYDDYKLYGEYGEMSEARAVSMNYTSGDYGNIISIDYSADIDQNSINYYEDYLNKAIFIRFNKDSIETADLIEMKADDNYIKQVLIRENDDFIEAEIDIDNYYMAEFTFHNEGINIELEAFNKDEYTVVLGISEDDRINGIANEIVRRIDNDTIKVYAFTVSANESKILDFMNEMGADLYIEMEMLPEEDATIMPTVAYYNPNYFIPGTNSVILADSLVQVETKATNDITDGIKECSDKDIIIKQSRVPAAKISLGYRKDADKGLSTREEGYVNKVADAFSNLILEERKKTL